MRCIRRGEWSVNRWRRKEIERREVVACPTQKGVPKMTGGSASARRHGYTATTAGKCCTATAGGRELTEGEKKRRDEQAAVERSESEVSASARGKVTRGDGR
jgi:hypothetical protein